MANKIGVVLAVWGALSSPVSAEAPLSAIDWLKRPAPVPVVKSTPPLSAKTIAPSTNAKRSESPVAMKVETPNIAVTSLGEPVVDAIGLLAPRITGLPLSIWRTSHAADLVRLVTAQKVDPHPAMQSLLYTLLLAEAEPPFDAGQDAAFLQARVNALIALGGVEPAQALLDPVATQSAALFQLWFDATLLTGDEDRACSALTAKPALSANYAARVYCTARSGDWKTAALTFDTARSLGILGRGEVALLQHFLDPEEFEGEALPIAPVRPSPLVFRLYEAVGEPMSTQTLPRAFAVADLRDTAGWKAQIEAAERLARTGALSENRLIDLYTQRRPAASGGVWDRVAAMQRFDEAVQADDAGSMATTLPRAWASIEAARLEDAFARAYGEVLSRLAANTDAGDLAYRIALLSPLYETAAHSIGPLYPSRAFDTELAEGAPLMPPQGDEIAAAIALGFAADTPMPADIASLAAEGKLGEAILATMLLFQTGAAGEPVALTGALSAFRALGLEETARRGALEVRLLRRGL